MPNPCCRRALPALAAFLTAIVLAGCLSPSSKVTVPNVVGLAQAAANSAISDAGLKAGTLSEAYSDSVPQGSVISQDPAAGANVASGSSVNLVISLGPQPAEVPIALVSLSHVSDSDGTVPSAGVGVNLFFEPGAVADLYIGGGTDAIAYTGTYAYQGGQLSLKFTSDDFNVDVTFAADFNASRLTLPFKLFDSATAGTSQWAPVRPALDDSMNCVFWTGVLADHESSADAVQRAAEYGNAAIGAMKATPAKDGAVPPDTVSASDYGVVIQYPDGPPLEVMLVGWSTNTGTGLTPSTLASDPRINLATPSPHDASCDPSSKTAVFIAPFLTAKSFAAYNFWWDTLGATPETEEGYAFTTADKFNFDAMQTLLGQHGYSVSRLSNDSVTILNIIKALLPDGGGTPGMIAFSTHGGKSGSLCTGVNLGKVLDPNNSNWTYGVWRSTLDALKAAGYGDMITYDGGTDQAPKTLSGMSIARDRSSINAHDRYMTITPKFWEWIQTRGADFSRSLVYMGCCNVDSNPDLHNAIGARALFAFRVPISPETAGFTFRYLCKQLVKHTRSAEEAYYNIIRLSNTRQMIYPEDSLFDGNLQESTSSQFHFMQSIFHGYGYDGGDVTDYQDEGWMKHYDTSSTLNPGHVWWLLFSERWSSTIQDGIDTMVNCWNDCWSGGSTGGLGHQNCQNASPGALPTEDEVAYATYLLSGTTSLPFSDMTVPRWTLNDGE